MCGPIGMVLGIAGGVVQGIGSAMAMDQQAKSYAMSAQAAERDANIKREQGSYTAARAVEHGNQVLGKQVAAYSASGIAANTGSPADVIMKTGQDIQMDVAAIRYGTNIAVANKDIEARVNRYNSRATSAAIPLAFAAPVLSAGGSYIKGMFGNPAG